MTFFNVFLMGFWCTPKFGWNNIFLCNIKHCSLDLLMVIESENGRLVEEIIQMSYLNVIGQNKSGVRTDPTR